MIIDDILEWIKKLPKWQQKLSYFLIENKSISEEDINEIYQCFKIESSLEEGSIVIEKIKFDKIEESNKEHEIIWNSIENLHGVNRLKSDEKLNISNGVTLIYGENGSGKSGYTRILNKAFISRGDQEILGNIYSSEKEDISAIFTFYIDGRQIELNYPEDKDKYPFKLIRNFDLKSAIRDMTEESVIDFAPSELLFFDLLIKYSLLIQEKLDNERESKKMDNPTVKYFSKEGLALKQMSNLSSSTKIDELKKIFAISEDEKKEYEKIKLEKARLVSLNIDKQIKLIDNTIYFLNNVIKKCDKFYEIVSEDKIDIYNKQIEFLKKCSLLNKENGLEIFRDENIEYLESVEWREFIKSAKNYYDKISNHDKCPLCGNKIDEQDIIFKYWKFLESESENNYKVAKESIRLSKESLTNINLTFLEGSTIQEDWLMDNFKEETKNLNDYFVEADKYRNLLIKKFEQENLITEKFEIKAPNIAELINKIEILRNKLNQKSINEQISDYTKFENEYLDKIKVNELIPVIINYIDYLKWDEKAQKSKIKTQSITTKQKKLFTKYVTEDYLKTFKEECKKLNADFDTEIVSRGKQGQTLKKLQIKGTVPGKILSEGEQKAIAIANFLTEVNMDKRNIGIVLDDPVSSLDHKRRSQIVRRLLDEARQRQVIIFTHEISFFIEMTIEAEKEGILVQKQTIRKICDKPGNISSIIPWQGMGVKDRIKKLNNELQLIISKFNAGEDDEYYYEAKKWCELLRESWERSVEEILFNDAIQRYNPCVQTQRLKKTPFSRELYCELEKGMSECSNWCHDQARAINGNIPSIDDLKKYIETFENYCKQNRVK